MTGGRIYLEGVGGDGGIKKNYREGPDLRAEGGQGAIIGAWFEIGHGTNQIPPGATLLLIIGEKGQDEWAVTASQAGGGGGTGILFQPDPSSGYNLLIVAGGGGGGAADCCLIQIHGKPGEVVQCVYNNGLPYNPYGSETYCYDDQTVYQDRYHCHQAGSVWDDNSDASYFAGSDHYPTPCECSGQMGWPGSQRKKVRDNPVKPTGGGMYGNCDDRASGGFGFGSGAPGKKNIATESSGGGGYTVTSTSGGGSYISPDFSTDEDEELYLERETTRNPEHGRVKYKIIPAPKAVCIDLEVSLPSSGTQAFAYFPMAFGSTTTIPGEGLLVEEVQSQEILTTLDCADIGTQAITLEVIGTISGYGSTCTANLTVKDEVSPALSCKNPTISTNENGNVSFSASDLIDSYSDNCSPTPASLTADHNGFSYDCTSNGQTITEHVKVTATDDYGNSKSCTATISIAVSAADQLAPIVSCKDVSVQLNSQGQGLVYPNQVELSSSDPCGGVISSYQFGQSHLELQVESEGFNADLSWTITSLDGNTVFAERPSYPHDSPSTGINSSETSFQEEITIAPGCYLFNWKDSHGDGFWCFDVPKFYRLTDQNGNVLAYGECDDIGYGQSTEFCIEPDNLLNAQSFDCNDIGDHLAALVVTDATGRKSNCQTTITVEAPAMQAVQCTPDLVQIQLDEDGLALLSIEQVLLADFLSCFDNQYSLSKTEFDCQDVGFSEVTLTANHPDGSSSSCEGKIRLRDNIPPTPLCKDITASLGPDGQVTIDASLADNGSTDHCGIFDLYFDDYRLTRTFDCENIGAEEFYPIMVEDYNGNLAYCDITLTIKNEIPPTVGCKDITIQLDENGIAHISEDAINDQSFATCGSLDFDTDITSFNCESLGDNLLTLTVQDEDGNSGTCNAVVTVEDKTAPIALCQNVSIQVDEDGLASTTAEAINMGSTDACGIANLSLNQGSFDCAETGTQTVILTVIDLSGNSSSCEATVTLEDKIIPVALCQNVSVQLNEDGQASISADILNNGSTDNCGIASLSLSKEHFDCTDIGVQTLLLTVIDASGNPSACEASITIEDKIAPTALCQNISVELDENGQANTSVEAVNNGSTDACGIANLSLSNTDFACADLGEREETLTVVDIHGNIATCQLTITVVDSSPPTITCPQDISVTTDEGECGAYISLPKAAPFDNCDIKNLKSRFREIMPDGTSISSWSDWASDQSGFFELGLYEIQWRAKDDSNHKVFCSFRLEVSDEEAPEVICKDVTIVFNGEDELAIPSSSIFDAAASFDACGTVSFLSQSLSVIDCDAVGQTVTVEVRGIDPNGNINSCVAAVEITGLPCGLSETNIDCDGETSVIFDPEQETFTLTAEDCTGYPNGEVAFVGQTLCGDGEISVRIDAVNPYARAGIVMMESTDPGAKKISLVKAESTYRISI